MAYLEVSAFKKLRAFFWGLQKSGFNLNRIPAKDNEGTPIDKAYCLNLLHSFPDFQGEQFKDDNTIVKYLSKPGNIKQILDQFTPEQQIELTKVFEEKPVAVEIVSEQPGGQETSAEQGVPAQTPGGESAGSMMGGIPSVNIQPAQRRVIRNVQQTKPPETAEPALEKRVPGLKNTPEAGLDHEGKPYEMDAEYKKPAPAKTENPPAGRTGRRFQAPKIPAGLSNIGKNFTSKAGIFFNRNIIGIARTGLGAFAGGVLTGGNPLAMLGGGIGGATFNAWGKKVLNGSINAGVRLSNQVSRGSFVKGGSKKIVFLFLGGFLLLAFGTAFLGTGTPGGGSTGNVGIGSTGPGGSGSIASCLFTRSDQNPKSVAFRSQQLLSLFQEASQKSGVPAAVLAGIARIESPSIANFTDANFTSYGCPTSETGAKGLMQVQPPGTTGSSQRGIELGAQYLGISVDQLNYCDLRQSIFLGAGVINAKRGGSWDPNKTNDKSYIDAVAETYYGCLRYGGPPKTACSDPRRIYSYGDDLFKSITECKPTDPVLADASCPIPEGKIGCASYGKVEAWGGFSGSCRPDSTGNGGHCNQNYVRDAGICGDVIRNGNLIRTAKSIDISNNSRAGDPVALPNINGKSARWKYIGAVSAGGGIDTVTTPGSSVPRDRPRYGWIRIFHSEGADEGVWTLHLIHVEDNLPPIQEGDILGSGLIGARLLNPWIRNNNWPHVHVTIGLNVGDSKNDLKDYNPGWKFADRELGMCAK